MGNKSGALILLIMLIVSAFVILMVKLAAYIRHFNGETRRIIMKMQRAADEKEYCYWHKMLRCHYLCLIPFVNERNVSGAYSFFFHQPKRAEKETRIDGVFHILAPSLAAFCLCAVCLCGVSWAWFTASTSTGTTAIQSSSYKLSYQVNEDTAATELTELTELTEADNTYKLTADTAVITLKATGTAGATGYCSIKIGDETYCTEQIFVNDTSESTFTVKAAAGTTITITPKWGTYSHDATLHNGDVITATGSQQSNTQAPDNTVTAEPSTEPAPTTPTVPTTPSSTPKESTTTAPELSATAPAPTQPESTTDTEPTPASEETTADPTEPLTTEEIKSN